MVGWNGHLVRVKKKQDGSIHRDHDARCLDHGICSLPFLQPEVLSRFLRDDGHDLGPAGQLDDYLGVDRSGDDLLHGSFQNVACAELQFRITFIKYRLRISID
jgi:hypothetical protein